MFSQVSVCPHGGVCPIACWETHPTPGRHPQLDTPYVDTPLGRHPLGGTPLGRHP